VVPTALPAPGELVTTSFETVSPAANKWTSGATQILGQGSEWDRAAPTSGTRKITASAKERQTPLPSREIVPEMGSRVEGSITTTVTRAESPASKLRSVSSTTEDAWVWGTRRSVTHRARVSEDERKMTTTQGNWPGEETERVKIALDAARKTIRTIKPSVGVSEQAAWEATVVSQQRVSGSTEGSILAPGMWTFKTLDIEVASLEGSTDRDLESTVGDSGQQGDNDPQATPGQDLAAGPPRPLGKGSSMKRYVQSPSLSWDRTSVPLHSPFLQLTSLPLYLQYDTKDRGLTHQLLSPTEGPYCGNATRVLLCGLQAKCK
jgi:high affinity immunoglobulin alpha/mu Fc receptor